MGTVELVADEDGQRLARKRMRPSGGNSGATLAFRREFHTLATLHHPAIVAAREFGVEEDGSWYTMEFLEGEDLCTLGEVAWPRACEILREVASALALLHGRRLIHRDVKPSNVKLDSDGHARLIDFGVMTSFGSSPEVAGTPAYLAPESVAGLPLDQGVDLYALGGLAYWMLTGTNAVAASNLKELSRAWAQPLIPPSVSQPEVPPALDDLVLGLLARDPLARPASAAEVIERLTAIAGLEPVASEQPTTWTLSGTVLAGRSHEINVIDQVISAAGAGEVSTVLFSGPSGMGKSRLLREAVLRGQIAGATPIEIPCSRELGDTRPYAALALFAAGLLRRDRELTLAAARPVKEDLGLVLPDLAAAAGATRSRDGDLEPGEARLRAIDAVRVWLGNLSETLRPIAILDDLQWCDEGSAALFASLQRETNRPLLLMFAGLRTDVPAIAQASVRALREAGRTHRLRPLCQGEIETMAAGIFGDAEHLASSAEWLHRASGGSPMLCIDLAHHLIDAGHARYSGGLWLLPAKPEEVDVPEGLAEASDARVRRLSAQARAVAGAIAILGRSAPTAVVHRLVDLSYDDLFTALDQLITQNVVGEDREELRITHDALHEALLRGMNEATRRRLHRRAAEVLQSQGELPNHLEARLGWHWLRGGEARRGADLLARAGQRYHAAQAAPEAIPLLEAALQVYEAQDVEHALQFRLRLKLLSAGVVSDLALHTRLVLPTLEQAWRLAALNHAQTMARFVGRPLALIFALSLAWLRWLAFPSIRRVASPGQALEGVLIGLFGVASSAAHRNDRELAALIRPYLALFLGVKAGLPFAMARVAGSFLDIVAWRPAQIRLASEEALRAEQRDRITPIGELERQAIHASAVYNPLFVAAFDMDPTIFDGFPEPRGCGLRTVEVGQALLEAAYHHARGELPQARQAFARFERDQVALGRAWMWDSILGWHATLACAWNRDVLGLRRSIARLERLVQTQDHRHFEYLELARGEYLRERGDREASLAILAKLDARVTDHGLVALATPVAYAETMLAVGDLEGAREAAERARGRATSAHHRSVPYEIRSLRALALIAAAQGEHDAAQETLERAYRLAESSQAPTLLGSLYEAEAQIAYTAGDRLRFTVACSRAREVYAGTENPTLIARAERLATLDRAPGSPDVTDTSNVVTLVLSPDPAELLRSRVAAARTAAGRYCAALDTIVELTEATAGYAFAYAHGTPELVAPEHGTEPPREVDEAVASSHGPTDSVTLNDGWCVTMVGQPIIAALALQRPSASVEVFAQLIATLGEVLTRLPSGSTGVPARSA